MTQEEKAKRYDEKLDAARHIYADPSVKEEDKYYIEVIFPELCESEDEKIRKELIEYIKDQQYSFISAPDCRDKYEEEDNDRYNSWIAWLEKQGEHANFRNKIQIGDKVTRNEDGVLVNLSQLNRVAKKDEKQDEQNPYGQRKESEDERTWIINYLSNRKLNSSIIAEKENLKKAIDWLEKQGEQKPVDKIQLGKKYKCIASPRYSTFRIGEIYKPEDKFLCSLMNFCSDCFEPIEDEQKPAWSEEDINKIDTIIGYIASFAGEKLGILLPCINWLKSLKDRVQPQPKPVEWSEEDERVRIALFLFVEAYGAHANYEVTQEEMLSWLKSLRPQNRWKPSESDILLLERIANGNSNPQDFQASLGGLIGQLKKLK